MQRKSITFALETLESRTLLTVPPVVYMDGPFGTVAVLQGTDVADSIVVSQKNATSPVVCVEDGVTTNLDVTTRFLYIDGNGGNDVISQFTTLTTIVHGGTGNDTIYTATSQGPGFNIIYGDEGNDRYLGDVTRNAFYQDPADTPNYPGSSLDVLGNALMIYGRPSADVVLVYTTYEGNHVGLPSESTDIILDPSTSWILADGAQGTDTFNDSTTQVNSLDYGDAGVDKFLGTSGDRFFQENSPGPARPEVVMGSLTFAFQDQVVIGKKVPRGPLPRRLLDLIQRVPHQLSLAPEMPLD